MEMANEGGWVVRKQWVMNDWEPPWEGSLCRPLAAPSEVSLKMQDSRLSYSQTMAQSRTSQETIAAYLW